MDDKPLVDRLADLDRFIAEHRIARPQLLIDSLADTIKASWRKLDIIAQCDETLRRAGRVHRQGWEHEMMPPREDN